MHVRPQRVVQDRRIAHWNRDRPSKAVEICSAATTPALQEGCGFDACSAGRNMPRSSACKLEAATTPTSCCRDVLRDGCMRRIRAACVCRAHGAMTRANARAGVGPSGRRYASGCTGRCAPTVELHISWSRLETVVIRDRCRVEFGLVLIWRRSGVDRGGGQYRSVVDPESIRRHVDGICQRPHLLVGPRGRGP